MVNNNISFGLWKHHIDLHKSNNKFTCMVFPQTKTENFYVLKDYMYNELDVLNSVALRVSLASLLLLQPFSCYLHYTVF